MVWGCVSDGGKDKDIRHLKTIQRNHPKAVDIIAGMY